MEGPQEVNIDLPLDPATPVPGMYQKEVKVWSGTDICTPLFTTALFRIVKRWKQLRCPLTEKWVNKMWSIHRREYHSALKRKEILTDATTWMSLEDIMLSEISQSPKDKY